MFNESFLKILEGEDPLEGDLQNQKDIFSTPTTLENIIQKSRGLIHAIKNPQKLIETTEDYYVAIDMLTDYIYICFKNMMVFDIDTTKYYTLDDTFIINHFSKKHQCYRIFKTRNGYHVFCISQEYNYRDLNSAKLMLENFTDYYYIVFSYIRGWCVRLNRKEYEKSRVIYKDLGVHGQGTVSKKLLEYTDYHIELTKRFISTSNIQ